MNRLSPHNRIAFISSYPSKQGGNTVFAWCRVDRMSLAVRRGAEPVLIVLQSDVCETHGEGIDFVIHKEIRSDYMDAADFINAGNIDHVELELELRLLGDQAGMGIELLLRHLRVPVITTLHWIPENPSSTYFQRFMDICDVSWKILVMNQRGVELLKKTYGISGRKIEQAISDLQEISSEEDRLFDDSAVEARCEHSREGFLCNEFYG